MLLTRSFWNDFFDNGVRSNMSADVIENEKDYNINVNLPGFKKEDISISLDNGYLTVSGERKQEENKNYIRRERYYGKISRSFYVGDNYTEEDVKAKFEDGVLTITLPKDVKKIDNKKYIQIA